MRITRATAVAFGLLTLAGCRASDPTGGTVRVDHPTFSKDVAPILFERCTPCHRPGQAVPFSLLDYADARTRARQIAAATASRFMPPWLPEPGYGEFAHERRLRDDQIDLIRRWVEQGAVEGGRADLPPTPAWTEGWQLGEPDLVVRVPQPYLLQPGDADVFRNFVVPMPPASATQYVRAVEFQPGNPRILHHATIGVDRTRSSRRLDEEDPGPGYEGMLSEGVESPAGHFLGWTPGKVPTVQPPDMSWPLERGTDLVVQLHMIPAGTAETIQPTVGFYFSDTPPTRTPFVIKLSSKTIDIPPGQKDYTIKDSYTLPADVDALSVYPHAHYLARDIKAFATLPGGTVTWLVWIKDWDFHRQDQYQYASPLFLPRGTVLTMEYTYDNSAENTHHPQGPPRRVMFGPQSSDEMGDLWLQVLPRNRADVARLARDYVERELKADIASAEMMVRRLPQEPGRHNFLGARYVQVGRIDEAIPYFHEALRLNPRYAEAHNNLGDALLSTGRTGEAIRHLREAVALRPNDERIHFNLGNALRAVGREDEAIREFRRTVAINPDMPHAHNNLGVALASKGQLTEAVPHFQQALAIDPDYADAHNNLGMAFGSLGKMDEAIRHVRRALEIRPGYADAQNNLQLLLRSGTQ